MFLLGPLEGELGASRYLQLVLELEVGPVPQVDFELDLRLARVVRELVRLGLAAVKDVSDGGLAVAAAEMCGGATGADLALPKGISAVRALFGEWSPRYLLAAPAAWEGAIERACDGLDLVRLGKAGGFSLGFRSGTKVLLDQPVADLAGLRERGLAWLE